jgi:hypothetical protein
MRETALMIRGRGDVRALIAADGAESVYAWRIGRAFDAAVVPVGMADELTRVSPDQSWIFPIAWLGLNGNVLPRVQKMRAVQPDVWRHRWMEPAAVVSMERASLSG